MGLGQGQHAAQSSGLLVTPWSCERLRVLADLACGPFAPHPPPAQSMLGPLRHRPARAFGEFALPALRAQSSGPPCARTKTAGACPRLPLMESSMTRNCHVEFVGNPNQCGPVAGPRRRCLPRGSLDHPSTRAVAELADALQAGRRPRGAQGMPCRPQREDLPRPPLCCVREPVGPAYATATRRGACPPVLRAGCGRISGADRSEINPWSARQWSSRPWLPGGAGCSP